MESDCFLILLLCDLTFHEVVEVTVVGAVVFDGVPGLRDGHGLQTKKQLYSICYIKDRQTQTGAGIRTDSMTGRTLQNETGTQKK